MEIKQSLLMPLKGMLTNIWLLIVYLFSLLLFIISVQVGTAFAILGVNLGQGAVIGISLVFALLTAVLQLYVLGVFGRTIAQQEHHIQSKGFFNSIGVGLKIVGVSLPYYAIFTASLFAYGPVALAFTITYLILLVIITPAILLVGTRKFIDGWNPVAVFKRAWNLDYAKALGVGIPVLVVGYLLIRGIAYGVFIIASAIKAATTQYFIISGASFVLVGLVALYTLFAYMGLFFTDAQATEEGKPAAKAEPKPKEENKKT